MCREVNTLITDFPDYNLKKGVKYQQLSSSELDDISMIVLKVNMAWDKSLKVVAIYRQWH